MLKSLCYITQSKSFRNGPEAEDWERKQLETVGVFQLSAEVASAKLSFLRQRTTFHPLRSQKFQIFPGGEDLHDLQGPHANPAALRKISEPVSGRQAHKMAAIAKAMMDVHHVADTLPCRAFSGPRLRCPKTQAR